MRPPDTIFVDGRAFSWRRLCTLRRQQVETWKKTRPHQPALFELKQDARPRPERSAAGRYQEPGLLTWQQESRE